MSYNGIDYLRHLSGNKDYGFEDIPELSADLAFKRIEEICDFFKNYQHQSKVVKKQPKKETAGFGSLAAGGGAGDSESANPEGERVKGSGGAGESKARERAGTGHERGGNGGSSAAGQFAEPVKKKVAKVQMQLDEKGKNLTRRKITNFLCRLYKVSNSDKLVSVDIRLWPHRVRPSSLSHREEPLPHRLHQQERAQQSDSSGRAQSLSL